MYGPLLFTYVINQSPAAGSTSTILWANSADDKRIIFLLFSPEKRLWHSCNCLCETICMKCQNLFLGKIRKYISKCRLLKFLPRMLSAKSLLNLYLCHSSALDTYYDSLHGKNSIYAISEYRRPRSVRMALENDFRYLSLVMSCGETL